MVAEMRRQNRPYIFLSYEPSSHNAQVYELRLVNRGTRVAKDIRLKILRDAKIFSWSYDKDEQGNEYSYEEDYKVSSLPACKEGIAALPPNAETIVGFADHLGRLQRQHLEYSVSYCDGDNQRYEESYPIDYWA
jgi:hypothetical protein